MAAGGGARVWGVEKAAVMAVVVGRKRREGKDAVAERAGMETG
jgi:hypothetical protein